MALNHLPNELTERICHLLDDQDLCSFRLVCKNAQANVDRPGFWHSRFLESYDAAHLGTSFVRMREMYQERHQLKRDAPDFETGHSTAVRAALRVILSILVDARPIPDIFGVPDSPNFTFIDHLIINTNLLDCIGRSFSTSRHFPHRLLATIQVVLSCRSLSFIKPPQVFGSKLSQQQAYLPAVTANLFSDIGSLQVNVEWALHLVNFFRNHLLRAEEFTLRDAYKELDRASNGLDLPQYWKRHLKNQGPRDAPKPLGKNWKGTYAYLERHEVAQIRARQSSESEIYQDHNVDLGRNAIQSMILNFPSKAPFDWPASFEECLRSRTFRDNVAAARRPVTRGRRGLGPVGPLGVDFRFEGVGYDDEEFYSTGWINQLPPQEGIPGWKRMTMMKYFLNPLGQVDADALWAYEGIVLPGDQIIVGRWWSPESVYMTPPEEQYCGPFILWNTDCKARASFASASKASSSSSS